MSCEWALKALKQARELAVKDSKDKPGEEIVVRIHCQITGCPMSFVAGARDGVPIGGGVNEGYPCSTTKGGPF